MHVAASAVLYEQQEKKKRPGGGLSFSGSLISYPANVQHLEQNYIQLSPTPFAETLQSQRNFACVHHKSQGILENGPHKSRPIGNLKRGFLDVFIREWQKGGKIELEYSFWDYEVCIFTSPPESSRE